jgi:hypothetical protein
VLAGFIGIAALSESLITQLISVDGANGLVNLYIYNSALNCKKSVDADDRFGTFPLKAVKPPPEQVKSREQDWSPALIARLVTVPRPPSYAKKVPPKLTVGAVLVLTGYFTYTLAVVLAVENPLPMPAEGLVLPTIL